VVQDFFDFPRTHKLIIVSNNKPVIVETKHAIWRRVRLIPFEVIIPESERDTQLTEWAGILSWLMEGYRDWKQNGMQTPEEVLVATRNHQEESNGGTNLDPQLFCDAQIPTASIASR
jgi:putative DNA primase/helicase